MLVWNWYSTGIILAFRFVKILATVFNLWGKESLIFRITSALIYFGEYGTPSLTQILMTTICTVFPNPFFSKVYERLIMQPYFLKG